MPKIPNFIFRFVESVLLRFYFFDEFGRISSHYGHGRHIAGDDAVRADDGAVTDPYAGQHSGTYADPNLIFNDNGFTVRRAAVVRIRVMIDGDQVHFRRDEHTVADGDAATVEKRASLLNPAAFTDADVLAEIHVKRR